MKGTALRSTSIACSMKLTCKTLLGMHAAYLYHHYSIDLSESRIGHKASEEEKGRESFKDHHDGKTTDLPAMA